MKISNTLMCTGAFIGTAVAAGGTFVLPLFCTMPGMPARDRNACFSYAFTATVVLAVGGCLVGACAGKVTGIAVETLRDGLIAGPLPRED